MLRIVLLLRSDIATVDECQNRLHAGDLLLFSMGVYTMVCLVIFGRLHNSLKQRDERYIQIQIQYIYQQQKMRQHKEISKNTVSTGEEMRGQGKTDTFHPNDRPYSLGLIKQSQNIKHSVKFAEIRRTCLPFKTHTVSSPRPVLA